jgi:hypothetical protein
LDRRGAFVALVVSSLVLAACGSDGNDAATTTAPAPAASSTSPASSTTAGSTTTGSGATVSDLDAAAVEYVGGKAQAATGSSVRIGIVNATSGPAPNPTVDAAAKAAVAYANSHLNGINGHKVELADCDLNSDETGQSCGTQMVNDSSINTVVMGLVAFGGPAFYKVIDNKKAVIQTTPISASDFDPYPGNQQPNVFTFGSGVQGQLVGIAKYLSIRMPKPKNILIVAVQAPAAGANAQLLTSELAKRGFTAKTAVVPFGAGSAQVASAIQAAGGDSADVWFTALDSANCAEVYKYQQANKLSPFMIATGGCLSTVFKPLTPKGGQMPDGWVQTDPGASVLVPSGEPMELLAARELKDVMANSALPQYDAGMFIGLLHAIKAMNIAGDGADVAAISNALRNLPGPIVENAIPVPCGSIPNYPTICGTGVGLITSKDGVLTRLAPTPEMPIIDFTE